MQKNVMQRASNMFPDGENYSNLSKKQKKNPENHQI
jgi:hypothetical protein